MQYMSKTINIAPNRVRPVGHLDLPEPGRAVYTLRQLRLWLASQVVSPIHNHEEGDRRPDCIGCATEPYSTDAARSWSAGAHPPLS